MHGGFPKLAMAAISPSRGVPLADVAHSVLCLAIGDVRPWRRWIGRVFGGSKSIVEQTCAVAAYNLPAVSDELVALLRTASELL